MKRKTKFNAIIFRDLNTKGFVYMQYRHGKAEGEAFNLNLQPDFMQEEMVNGKFPKNKIILSDVEMEGDSEIMILPKFCVELKIEGKPVDFWHVLENPSYFSYFMNRIGFKLSSRAS